MLPGRKSGFRDGFRPDSTRESLKIGPPAGLRPVGGRILKLSRLESGPEALLRNIGYNFATMLMAPGGPPISVASGPDGPKPYKFIGFGDSHGPKPYKFIVFGPAAGGGLGDGIWGRPLCSSEQF